MAFALRNLAWNNPILRGVACVFTIHNLGYQGITDAWVLALAGFGGEQFTVTNLYLDISPVRLPMPLYGGWNGAAAKPPAAVPVYINPEWQTKQR